MSGKRLFDFVFSVFGLIVLLPLFVLVSIMVKAGSRGPVFFKQKRIGKNSKEFSVIKFRTMEVGAERLGGRITPENDKRVTYVGRTLRKYKLDELPQIFNVLMGDMSFVGPRPEVSEFVQYYPIEAKKKVLSIRPGITDPASIQFRNEGETLSRSSDPERLYIEKIIPQKLALYETYVDERSLLGDIKIILTTFAAIACRR